MRKRLRKGALKGKAEARLGERRFFSYNMATPSSIDRWF
jgi:hypothetical protein